MSECDFVCGGIPTSEAHAEIQDYRAWLALPRPRQEFHAWRKALTAERPAAEETR